MAQKLCAASQTLRLLKSVTQIEQAQEQWQAVALTSSQLTFTCYADTEAAAAAAAVAADPLQVIQHVVNALHSRAEEAQAAVEKLTQQLQEAAAAHALEAEHLRQAVYHLVMLCDTPAEALSVHTSSVTYSLRHISITHLLS